MHEIMTREKYAPSKIDEKKAKYGKATLQEVKEEKEEEDKETEAVKNTEERGVNDIERETQGKWSTGDGFYRVCESYRSRNLCDYV